MIRRLLVAGLLVAVALAAVAALAVLREPEEASTPIEAISLEIPTEEHPTSVSPEVAEADQGAS